jgi:class 3 adenylate cyclase/tetratricopeptide (TPR) repeat protein
MHPTGTVTFLFTDIEASTERWDRDRAAMQWAVRSHDQLVRAAIEAGGGVVFKTIGDAFCAAFSMPESAASSAIDAQRALASEDFSAIGGLAVRMAINTGTADERDGDYFGPTVNRVARLLSLAHGGQVLLSGIAADLVRENPPPGAALVDLGTHALRGLERHERVYQLVAPGLQPAFPPLRVHNIAHQPWIVPDALRTHYFTGRDDLLTELREQLTAKRRAALSGLGGIGKTQAALAYATRHRADYPHGVFWINAETAGGVTAGLVEVAKALRLPSAGSNDHELVARTALDWLNQTDGWLMILDNVEDRREVARFVSSSSGGHVVITSREQVLPELGVPRALRVPDLDMADAVRFLFARSGREPDEPYERDAAMELAHELGALPLALEQAAAYVAETGAGFAAYLAAFRRRRVSVLERSSDLVAHDTVSVTWAENFAAVERISADAAAALRTSAFLAPDAVPLELFAPQDGDELTVSELLRPGSRFSLIQVDAGSQTFAVHRLVQEVVRDALEPADRERYAQRAFSAVDSAFPDVEFTSWPQCDRLIAHAVALAEWARTSDARPQAGIQAINRAGRYLLDRGRFDEAVRLMECVLAVGERHYGSEDAVVAVTLNVLAAAHAARGEYARAQALHERALAIRERALEPTHTDIAQSLNNLANVYFFRAQYAEAEPLYRRALSISESALGPEHYLVAANLHNLGQALGGLGRHGEAEDLHERALAIRERTLGTEHPHFALSLSSLAAIRREQGRFDEAEAMSARALAIRERALGPDHPDVAETLNELALTRTARDPGADVESLHERALAIYGAIAADHPMAADTLCLVADLRLRRGRPGDAEPLYERALAIAERIGDAHLRERSLRGISSVCAARGSGSEDGAMLDRGETNGAA